MSRNFSILFLLIAIIPLSEIHAATFDTLTVRKLVDEMASKMPSVKNVKDALVDEYLNRIPFEQVGIYQKRSLKLYKGDKDFLDDVISNALIKKAEDGKSMPYSVFTPDTFFNTHRSDNSTDCFAVLYYCKKVLLKNNTPVYIFASQEIMKERFPVYGEEEVRGLLNERNKAIEPFLKLRKWGDDLKQRNILLYAIIVYQAYKKNVTELQKVRSQGGNLTRRQWMNGMEAYQNIPENYYFDTSDICVDSLKAIASLLRVKYKAAFDQIDTLTNQIAAIEKKRSALLKTALVLSGEVRNRQGSTLQIWGTASPFNSVNPESGLFGVVSTSINAALSQSLSQFTGGSDGVDDIPGAVVYEKVNLIVEGYDQQQKYMGSASVGGTILAGPYVYKGQSTGANAFGADVVVRNYIPHPNTNELSSQKASISKLTKLSNDIQKDISDKEQSLLTKEDLAQLKNLSGE